MQKSITPSLAPQDIQSCHTRQPSNRIYLIPYFIPIFWKKFSYFSSKKIFKTVRITVANYESDGERRSFGRVGMYSRSRHSETFPVLKSVKRPSVRRQYLVIQ